MDERTIPVLYLVVPCYNEEEIIEKSAQVMSDKLRRMIQEERILEGSKVMFVNDGSKDKTLRLLHEIAAKDSIFSVVSLAGNYGHQSAILAGMMMARKYADVVVTIDADLQQDIEALDKFLASYMAGSEVVYGVRNDRHSDGVFKKGTATAYYKLMHLLGSKVITNHADYRLMSKKALNALAEYKETNLFLRGLIPTMGFASDVVYFDVKEREAGHSKYTLSKMMTLAMDGITSMSVRPLRMIAVLGILVCLFSVIMCIISFVDWLQGNNVPGYTTSLIVSLIMGGVTLFSLGIIGEYIGKIYMETKKRPRYIIDTFVWKEDVTQKGEDDV
ncbi:MAG: glycosyltransferase family 2 protein [Lachnospiraceae bacterium]|nr:glycosyltransferase family 2 protein [Lachnospiraceae bacterium]